MTQTVTFPEFSGLRCLMMPYVQGEPDSVPGEFAAYATIIREAVIRRGDVGYLTIDESLVEAGKPHRGNRAKNKRAIHTEAGLVPSGLYCWGTPSPGWGGSPKVTLGWDVEILLANSLDDSCATWGATHADTSLDGDIGHAAGLYPYENASFMKAGELRRIGILTPHESLPVKRACRRQFLRVVGSGVHGREPYFTENPLLGGSGWGRGY